MMMVRPLGRIVALVVLIFSCGVFPVALQAQSKAQMEWDGKVPKGLRSRPAFEFVEDQPGLPRVLLIGDSISIGYTAVVREELKGKANVHRIPENGGDTGKGLEMLSAWLGDGRWDVIHFNWGLHDLKYLKDGQLDLNGEQVSPPETYRVQLNLLTERLLKTGAKLIWASTTPVPPGAGGRIPGDEIRYNEIALEVMQKLNVQVDDLYLAISSRLKEMQQPENVHFTDEGYAYLGKVAAQKIQTALPKGR